MNRKICLILACVFSLLLNAQQSDKQYRHWSVGLSGGGGYFDGDISYSKLSLSPVFGLDIRYNYRPLVAFGFEYYNYSLNVKSVSSDNFKSMIHQPGVFLSLSTFDCFGVRRKRKSHLNLELGLGLAYYNSDYYLDKKLISSVSNGVAVGFPFGFNYEYDVSNLLSIGFKYRYAIFNKDNLEGYKNYSGTSNDHIQSSFLLIRWKFGAGDRHAFADYQVTDESERLAALSKIADSLVVRSEVETKSKEIISQATAKIETELKKLQNFMSLQIDSINREIVKLKRDNLYIAGVLSERANDSDGDGVPNLIDKELASPPGAYVDFWGRKIDVGTSADVEATLRDNGFYSLFFNFDSYTLKPDYSKILYDAAQKLIVNKELKVEVRGYADKTGTYQHNQDLSEHRALIVRNALIYLGVDAGRISVKGCGPKDDTDLRKWRRCDIVIQ